VNIRTGTGTLADTALLTMTLRGAATLSEEAHNFLQPLTATATTYPVYAQRTAPNARTLYAGSHALAEHTNHAWGYFVVP